MRLLGTFLTDADHRRASRNGFLVGGLLFAVTGAIGARTIGVLGFGGAVVVGLAVWFFARHALVARTERGVVMLENEGGADEELVLTRKGPGIRVPLAEATFVAHIREVPGAGRVRLQIELQWAGKSIVALLAVPFRGAPDDQEPMSKRVDYHLDRDASRAFDALSYPRPRSGARK